MKNLVLAVGLLVAASSFSQLNIDSLSHINYNALHGASLNDVWGYVDEMGNEYAIVGTSKGTSIVDVTNPHNPVEVFWLPGATSIWRDPCVYGNYAYITTEAQAGLSIIDLSPLPASTNLPTTTYTGPLTNPWQSAHTCFLDENGYAYIFGANRGNGGAIILDVHTNPMQPIEVGTFDDWYVHDGFVRNDTMYLAHILDGFFSLVDISTKSNPVLLGTQTTPNNFTHTIWPTLSGAHAFTTDELSGAYITAYSISNPSNIVEVDRTQHSPNKGVIPHNVHVRGDYLITSYYSDGITIHDVSHPDNMILVGEYDTYPTQTTNFDGCWGVYPYLPSGTILAADITEGLFILAPHYHKASYLVGNVSDSISNAPLSNVSIQLATNDQVEHTNSFGDYATGIYGTGTYSVTYLKVGYFPKTFSLTLSEGLTTTQNVQLTPIPPYPFTLNVVESGTGLPIADAQISLKAALAEYTGLTNGIGEEDFTLYYQENYFMTVAKWGYTTQCIEQSINDTTHTLTVTLGKAYYDDFSVDLGWTVMNNTPLDGAWERGKPFGTSTHSAPSNDADFDCNDKAYITGNASSLNPDLNDLDGGPTVLKSPLMDLTTYSDPYLNYARWFFCLHGHPADDTLKVIVSNGLTSVIVDRVGGDPTLFHAWHPQSIRLTDFIAITNSMQVRFEVSDLAPNGNVTEAGIDYVYISNQNVLEINENNANQALVYPNPFAESLTLAHFPLGKEYSLISLSGATIYSGKITADVEKVSLQNVEAGYYLLTVGDRVFKLVKTP